MSRSGASVRRVVLLVTGAVAITSSCSTGRVVISTASPTTAEAPVAETNDRNSTASEIVTTSTQARSTTTARRSTTAPSSAAPVNTDPTESGVAADGTVLALELLAAIVTENEHGSGYRRSLFKHWSDLDRDGCNTREEVLIEESNTRAQVDAYGCTVVAGDWRSRYDGLETDNPGDLDIDHVVALKEAWDSGAWDWSSQARELFANDLTDDRSLVAVSQGSNRSKSDKDPSNWMPPDEGDWCRYLGDWVSIKYRWNLSMDSSEHGRIRNLLERNCPGWRVVVPVPPPIDVPIAGGDADESGDSGAIGGSGTTTDTYYANCSEARAAGAAPIYAGQPGYRRGLDRDGDGVACE